MQLLVLAALLVPALLPARDPPRESVPQVEPRESRGRLVDPPGNSLCAGRVSAMLRGSRSRWCSITDAEGRFRFQDLAAGDYRVSVVEPYDDFRPKLGTYQTIGSGLRISVCDSDRIEIDVGLW